jgi:hypothetical protein
LRIGALFVVIRLYERIWLGVQIQHCRIREDLARDLFGEVFYWWYEVCFADLLSPTGWDSWQSISSLKQRFDKNPDAQQREVWLNEANADHQNRVQAPRAPIEKDGIQRVSGQSRYLCVGIKDSVFTHQL